MNIINKTPINFIPEEYNNLRFTKSGKDNSYYRNLTSSEIEILIKQENVSRNWDMVLVTDKFEPTQVRLNEFTGLVRIDDMEPVALEFHDLKLPVGIYNSHIISCDIGKNASIHGVSYMSRVIVGNNVILRDINEIVVSDRAKFGNGIVRNNEDPKVRIELEIANEAGGREILPFTKLLTPDAYLWYKYRGDKDLMSSFRSMVDNEYGKNRGEYGKIGDRTIIKNCRIIKDVDIGTDAYIKGCNKLKNLTILSSPEGKTQIGEGCELVNGIIGEGCRIFYGAMAVRFQMMSHSSLKYGARLINSVLGDNSTISCCEVLNSFIFPGHEQHHNSSFLIASVLMGQTNIASGATIGSNHNSRKNDGELVAGRGFWPGLNTSLKHNSRFASYTMLVKGSYQGEIDNPFPFSLMSISKDDTLVIYPGYWFVYNMYALERNKWKYGARDKRTENFPFLEFDYIAPDTVTEMYKALDILDSPREIGKIQSRGSVRVHHPTEAREEYVKMIDLYIGQTLLDYLENGNSLNDPSSLKTPMEWINCGGQLIPAERVNTIIYDVKSGSLDTWDKLHNRYRELSKETVVNKFALAKAVYTKLKGKNSLELSDVSEILNRTIEVKKEVRDRVYSSRLKDFKSRFKKMIYNTPGEMEAVIGKETDDSFFKIQDEGLEDFITRSNKIMANLN